MALCDLQGTLPQRVVVWGMEPASLDWGTDLSPTVADRLDSLIESAILELRRWGVAVD